MTVPETQPILRVLSCGSVDDGKSTLIGRLLHDCGALFEDQLTLLEKERTAEGLPDFSSLLDGLLSEREQNITIDVAYRTLRTANRRFLIADAPGHEQYTRNMVTGASRADVALLLVDAVRAKDGLLPQTIRHTAIAALMGVPDIIVTVNKMDCVNYDQNIFRELTETYLTRIRDLKFRSVTCIPVSALRGDNVCNRSQPMTWYTGPTLLNLLETLDPGCHGSAQFADPCRSGSGFQQFAMPIQWVAPLHGSRHLTGTIVSGSIKTNDKVTLLPSNRSSSIKRILGTNGETQQAHTEDAVSIQLTDELDAGRGEVLTAAPHPLETADLISARMVWLNDPPLVEGRTFLFRLGTAEARATVIELAARVDMNTLHEEPTKKLAPNDIGRVKLALDRKLALTPYSQNRDLGGFLLVDRIGGNTLGAGMIEHALRRSHATFWHNFALNKAAHAAQKAQKPGVLWFTGLSASGKSTVANRVANALHTRGHHVYILDGDNLRHGLNRDLGFTEQDRAENIRRASEAAHLLVDAGLVVLAAFISPYRVDREAIRSRFAPREFFEIFMDTPLPICAERDPKGLYARAMKGELPNFTGVTAPFEPPESPDLHLDGQLSPDKLAEEVVAFFLKNRMLGES